MKLKSKSKKIIAISLFIMLIASAFIGNLNTVYGRVNTVYKTSGEVGSIDVDTAVSNSTVLDAIARMFYAIAGFIENIVGSIIKMVTGSKVFPWADRVIFNTMPFLDINFLTPSNGSMFHDLSGNPTAMGKIIQNMYYTLFTIAVTFFGVVVGIMALKLAISSIASEKAKYKQAITNWLLALILLFTAHYLMSFIFFVNEKMVEVASSILVKYGEGISFDLDVSNMKYEDKRDFIASVMKEALSGASFEQNYKDEESIIFYNPSKDFDVNDSPNQLNVDKDNSYITTPFISMKWGQDDDYTEHWGFYYFSSYEDWKNFNHEWEGTTTNKDDMSLWYNLILQLYSDPNYMSMLSVGDEEHTYVIFVDASYIYVLKKYYGLDSGSVKKDDFINGIRNLQSYIDENDGPGMQYDVGDNDNLEIHYESLWEHVDKYYLGNSGNYKEEVFSGMSAFFKSAVTSVSTYEEVNEDGESETKVKDFNAIPAILFSIFVIQSIMYFITYLKRFFYIIILALFAPLVIIYDFLMKATA